MRQKRIAGMTLVELLCALAVVLLVSAGMVLGVSLAVRSYERSVAGSEAQVLCSTLETIVSDELRYAGTLKYDEGGKVVGFFSQNHPDADNQQSEFTTDGEGRVLLGGQKLLPNNAYPHGLRASVELKDYDEDEGKRIFTAVITVKDRGGDTLAQTELQVKQLNKPADTTPQG